MIWAVTEIIGAANLISYESELDRFVPRYPQTMLCLSDLDWFRGDLLIDIMRTHPKALVIKLDHRHVKVGRDIGRVSRPLLQQSVQQLPGLAVRRVQIEDQQRDDDGEHAVVERFGSRGAGLTVQLVRIRAHGGSCISSSPH
jgi:hypothetical protein